MTIDKNLINWLEDEKMLISNKSNKERTHNVMEFGQFLSIRSDKFEEFLQKLAKTLDNGIINFLLEIRTDYFKFMVDVDFKSELGLTHLEKRQLMKMIQIAVNDCVNIRNNYLIISSCDDEEIIYNDQKMIKIGFHLIWPNLVVGIDEARYLRSGIIQYLEINFKILSFNNWEDIIDNSMYDNQHALRMNGSAKNVKCPHCKGKNKLRVECIKCKASGKFNEGRIYKPYIVLTNDGNDDKKLLNILLCDNFKNLKLTSIRTQLNKSNIKISEEKYPKWFSKNKLETHLYKGRKKRKPKSNHPFVKNSDNKQEEISENSIIYKNLTQFMKSQLFKLSMEYNDIEFDKLKKMQVSKYKFIYIITTKNQYCLNMKREHSNNHIYFVISDKTIIQKCPSPWKNLQNEYCKDFKSKPLSLNTKLRELLFQKPIENEKLKTKKKPIRIFSIDD